VVILIQLDGETVDDLSQMQQW